MFPIFRLGWTVPALGDYLCARERRVPSAPSYAAPGKEVNWISPDWVHGLGWKNPYKGTRVTPSIAELFLPRAKHRIRLTLAVSFSELRK